MTNDHDIVAALLAIINDVKHTGFTAETVEPDGHLGGEFGIDSVELLEVWFEAEVRLGIRVSDAEKRDLYTLADVVAVVRSKLLLAEAHVA